jgi:hypothetical protein
MLHFPWLIGTRSDPKLNVFMRLDSEPATEEALSERFSKRAPAAIRDFFLGLLSGPP